MKKEVFDILKKESRHIGILFVVAAAFFQIVFYKENFVATLRSILSLFWTFVLPGYAIMLYWREKLSFLERIIVGIIISAVLLGTLSYYLGLVGLNAKFHAIVIPLGLIVIGLLVSLKN